MNGDERLPVFELHIQPMFRLLDREHMLTSSARPVVAPSPGCRAWLSLDSVAPGRRAYTTYLEPALPAQPPAETTLAITEDFVKGDATTVVVRDVDGSHELTLP